MANKGAHPIDPTTLVGRLRETVGDTASADLSPAESGYRDYSVFSDNSLQVFLIESGGSVLRAAGLAFSRLAAEYSAIGRSIKTEDLNIDVRQRGKDLLEVAKSYYDQAAAADAAEAADFFAIVPGRASRGRGNRVEGSPWPTYTPLPPQNDLQPSVEHPGYWTT